MLFTSMDNSAKQKIRARKQRAKEDAEIEESKRREQVRKEQSRKRQKERQNSDANKSSALDASNNISDPMYSTNFENSFKGDSRLKTRKNSGDGADE